MRRPVLIGTVVGLMCFLGLAAKTASQNQPSANPPGASPPQWAMNATIIEACSCPMFCQCYFDTKPAAHSSAHAGHEGHGGAGGADAHGGAGGAHFCRANNAFKINTGHFGQTKLDGAKFWLAGDLGDDFSKGQMDWFTLTFDPAVTKEQREGIQKILGHLYPVQWKSFTVMPDKPMEWQADKDRAVAKLDGGKAAEVVLKRYPGMTDEPIVIKNLRYWGAPRNDGFVLMPNEVEALRVVPEGKQPFEFKGTNGFMITVDINANDVKK